MNHRQFGFRPTQAFEGSVTGEQMKSQEIPRRFPRHPANVDDEYLNNFALECRHLSNGGDRAWTTVHEDQNARQNSHAHDCPFGTKDKCSRFHVVEQGSHQEEHSPGDYNRQFSIYWKTKLCYRWSSSGQCPYGDQCSYAHGVAELRRPREDHRELYIKNAAAVPPKVDPSLAIDVLANTKPEMSSLPGAGAGAGTAQPKIRALTLEKSKRIYGDWIDDF